MGVVYSMAEPWEAEIEKKTCKLGRQQQRGWQSGAPQPCPELRFYAAPSVEYGQGCQSRTPALTRAIGKEQERAAEAAVTAVRRLLLAFKWELESRVQDASGRGGQ